MTDSTSEIESFWDTAREIGEVLGKSSDVTVVGHIDADGIAAASIASIALERAGVPHKVRFVKKLDPPEIDRINADQSEAVWLVDLGSGSFSRLVHPGLWICDHHIPDLRKKRRQLNGQNLLSSFFSNHLNPHLFNIDGSSEISGAGVTYCVARQMDPRNQDLSALALVGAVGDFQDSSECRLIGFNRIILGEAIESGLARAITDIRLFGRETRPLVRLLQYSTDPYLPGLTGSPEASSLFLQDLEIEQKEVDRWRHWIDLGPEERRKLASGLTNLLLNSGRGARAVRRLIGEVYLLTAEKEGTELHDTREFSTLLNACGRYGRGDVGMAICKGDRGEKLEEALRLQQSHRQNLSDAIGLVKELGLQRGQWVQYFHGRDEIIDSIVGIVAGMVLGSGEIEADLPLVAFALSEDNKVKVSARGTRDMVRKGLDLAHAVKVASERVGGSGGGHNIAAGGTINQGREEDFLREMEIIISAQMRGSSGSP
jgi:single-stranded-DNA-specific exonuclease